jgi:hypothetical protein
MRSQNATATLGNVTSCAGETVLVPIDVTDFNDVGAMTFYIGYDTNTAEFLSIQNINPAIPGSISANATNGQVGIAYSYTEPFYITGEKLFDLSFNYFGGSTSLSFEPGTEIANTMLEVLPLDTYAGNLGNSIQITGQPDSVQSYPDNDVTFGVSSLGDINFQWQENSGNGWIDLQNNNIYFGVTTDTLTISDVSIEFNGNTYRCMLTAGECTEISDIALLEVAEAFPVASLGFISSCPETYVLEPLSVGDFFDVTEFKFNISFNTEYLAFIDLENIYPELNSGTFAIWPLDDPQGITIHWEGPNPVSITSGTLFDLKFYYISQNHGFEFENGTYVLNSSSNPINITLNNGAIAQNEIPLIISQPENETVIELEDAFFDIEASGTELYQWMESIDGGNTWTDLTNTPPYYNTQSGELKISPASYDMNGFHYACRLNSELCSVNSTAAVLSVDTLTFINEGRLTGESIVAPVPFRDRLKIIPFGYSELNSIKIINMQGIVCFNYTLYNIYAQQEINLDLHFLEAGFYIMKIEGNNKGRQVTEQQKIFKSY